MTHGQEDALVHWCVTQGIRARPLHLVGYGDEGGEPDGRPAARGGASREPFRRASRPPRLRARPQRQAAADDGLFPHDARPERGFALAAMAGALYLRQRQARPDPRADRGAHGSRAVRPVLRLRRRPLGDGGAALADAEAAAPNDDARASPRWSRRCRRASRADMPGLLTRWLDALDETGRWALLKLITGSLRIGVSARLAKSARGRARRARARRHRGGLARAGSRPTRRCSPGRRAAPSALKPAIPRRSARPCCRTPSRTRISTTLDPADDRGRMEVGRHPRAGRGGRRPDGQHVARLYSRTGEDISRSFPDVVEAIDFDGRGRRRAAGAARGARADPSTCCSSGSTARA